MALPQLTGIVASIVKAQMPSLVKQGFSANRILNYFRTDQKLAFTDSAMYRAVRVEKGLMKKEQLVSSMIITDSPKKGYFVDVDLPAGTRFRMGFKGTFLDTETGEKFKRTFYASYNEFGMSPDEIVTQWDDVRDKKQYDRQFTVLDITPRTFEHNKGLGW